MWNSALRGVKSLPGCEGSQGSPQGEEGPPCGQRICAAICQRFVRAPTRRQAPARPPKRHHGIPPPLRLLRQQRRARICFVLGGYPPPSLFPSFSPSTLLEVGICPLPRFRFFPSGATAHICPLAFGDRRRTAHRAQPEGRREDDDLLYDWGPSGGTPGCQGGRMRRKTGRVRAA